MKIIKTEKGDKLEVSSDKQYEYLTRQLRYLDDKLFRSFALFITLATAIIGGTFYIYMHHEDAIPKFELLGLAASLMFFGVGLGSNFVINNNLRSWREYRKTLEERFCCVPSVRGPWWWSNEILGCFGIALSVGGFFYFNPIMSLPVCCSVGASLICFVVGILPLFFREK